MGFLDTINSFFHQGGPVLLYIFLVIGFMCFFILERVFYFTFEFSSDLKKPLEEWRNRSEKKSKIAQKIRSLEISRLSMCLEGNLRKIKVLVAICPLLGLLGTVTGMISVFEVMAEVGTGNARLMAGGIYMATIPTMAGMFSALIGLYCGNQLESYSKMKKQKVQELFCVD